MMILTARKARLSYDLETCSIKSLGYGLTERHWSYTDLQAARIPGAFTAGGVGYVGFFFILIHQSTKYPIGAGNLYRDSNKRYLADRAMWGLSGITRDQLEQIIEAIQQYKPAGTSCRFLAFDLDGSAAMDAPRWGAVRWGAFRWGAALRGNIRVIPVREPWETTLGLSFFNYSYLTP